MHQYITVSSQGQIVIPSSIRKQLGIQAGSKLAIRVGSDQEIPVVILEPAGSLTKRVKGIAKGVYGQGETFVDRARASWEK